MANKVESEAMQLDEIPEVDCKYAKKNLWLVKVQSSNDVVLSSAPWLTTSSCAASDSAAGAASSTSARSSLSMQPLGQSSAAKTDMPIEHQFIVQTAVDGQTLAVLSEDKSEIFVDAESTQGKLAVEGRVARRADCRPKRSAAYENLKKRQIETVNKPKNKIQQIDRAEQKFKPVDVHKDQYQKDKAKREGAKAVRVDKERLLDILFNLFEKHQYYKLIDLQTLTKQPTTYLKEVLNEIAHYNTAPPHRSMWELKTEYRSYKRPNSDKTEDS